MHETQTIKIRKSSLTDLRVIHAATGESLLDILERILEEEATERYIELAKSQYPKQLKTPTEK